MSGGGKAGLSGGGKAGLSGGGKAGLSGGGKAGLSGGGKAGLSGGGKAGLSGGGKAGLSGTSDEFSTYFSTSDCSPLDTSRSGVFTEKNFLRSMFLRLELDIFSASSCFLIIALDSFFVCICVCINYTKNHMCSDSNALPSI